MADFKAIVAKLDDKEKRQLAKSLMPERVRDGQVDIKAVQSFAHVLLGSITDPRYAANTIANNVKIVTKTKIVILNDDTVVKELTVAKFNKLKAKIVEKKDLQEGLTYQYVGSFGPTAYYEQVEV